MWLVDEPFEEASLGTLMSGKEAGSGLRQASGDYVAKEPVIPVEFSWGDRYVKFRRSDRLVVADLRDFPADSRANRLG